MAGQLRRRNSLQLGFVKRSLLIDAPWRRARIFPQCVGIRDVGQMLSSVVPNVEVELSLVTSTASVASSCGLDV